MQARSRWSRSLKRRRRRFVIPWEVREGWLYVYDEAGKTLVREQCNQVNFFPGLTLLLTILRQGGIRPPQAEARHASAEPVRTSPLHVDERIQQCAGAIHGASRIRIHGNN